MVVTKEKGVLIVCTTSQQAQSFASSAPWRKAAGLEEMSPQGFVRQATASRANHSSLLDLIIRRTLHNAIPQLSIARAIFSRTQAMINRR